MASLPPEPAEGCTLRLEIQPRGQAPRRLARKFDGDDTGEIVLRWLAAEGCADCFQDWRLYRVDVHPEVVVEESFSTQTLQSNGLWPSARLALRPRPTFRITVRTARSQDGECLLECFADETASAIARRACEKLPLFCGDRLQARDWDKCRLVYAGKIIEGLNNVDQEATLFLAPPPPTTTPEPPRVDEGPPTCRICYSEENSQEDPLISPCLCTGTMRHVHVSCLNAWRAAAPDARSSFRCDQCRYAYRIERTKVAAFLGTRRGALVVAFSVLLCVVVVTGYLCLLVVPPHKRVWLYRWLRLRTRLDHRAEEVITLGLACVGLGMFSLYACLEVAAAQHFRRPTPAALLAVWIAAEVRDARRGRALAVVGLWLAGQATWRTAFHAARALAQKIGDRVLDVQAGDCRRPFVQSPSSMMLKRLVFPKGLRVRCRQNF